MELYTTYWPTFLLFGEETPPWAHSFPQGSFWLGEVSSPLSPLAPVCHCGMTIKQTCNTNSDIVPCYVFYAYNCEHGLVTRLLWSLYMQEPWDSLFLLFNLFLVFIICTSHSLPHSQSLFPTMGYFTQIWSARDSILIQELYLDFHSILTLNFHRIQWEDHRT